MTWHAARFLITQARAGGEARFSAREGRDGDDLTVTLIAAVSYDNVKDAAFALPKAVKAAVAEKKRHSQ